MSDAQLDIATIPLDRVEDSECLHRRINPNFVKPDGSVSSQAFTDPEMSVDRAWYLPVKQSLLNYEGFGLVSFQAEIAKQLNQVVLPDPETTNLAHALVKGKKTKSTKRKLAKASEWVVQIWSRRGTL